MPFQLARPYTDPAPQVDLAGSLTKGVQLQNLMQAGQQQSAMAPGQRQIQQQTIQGNQQDLEMNAQKIKKEKQAQQDQQTIQQVAAAHNGNLIDALPDLQGKISPETYQGIVDHITETKKKLADLKKVELDNHEAVSNNMLGLVHEASDLPPDQYQAAWPQIATRALEINPKLQGQIDPAKPIPQVELSKLQLGITLESQLAAQSKAKREENAAKLAEKRQADAADLAERTQTERGRHNKAMENKPTAGTIGAGGGGLSEEAKNQAADRYAQTGVLPAMGMGAAGASYRRDIMNRAGERHPGGSITAGSAEYAANKASYANVTKTLDTLSAFENAGLKNLKQFTDLADKLPDTGVPWINRPVRELNKNIVGAEYMPAIEAARSIALREIARVTNDPKLSGTLTDSARHEVSEFSPTNATLPQIKHVVEVLRKDMENVHTSLSEQKTDIEKRLGSGITKTEQGSGNEVHYKIVGGKLVAQ